MLRPVRIFRHIRSLPLVPYIVVSNGLNGHHFQRLSLKQLALMCLMRVHFRVDTRMGRWGRSIYGVTEMDIVVVYTNKVKLNALCLTASCSRQNRGTYSRMVPHTLPRVPTYIRIANADEIRRLFESLAPPVDDPIHIPNATQYKVDCQRRAGIYHIPIPAQN